MIAFGHVVEPTRIGKVTIHRLDGRLWPLRYVVANCDKGWNHCDACRRQHRVWIADDRTWRLLPVATQGLRLCVACFRYFAKRKRADDARLASASPPVRHVRRPRP